jgi:hypothetical protein
VRHEYKHRRRDKPVDYALLLLGNPVLFVEAKGLGENLSDRRWASQVVSYAAVAGVSWVVLTDGDQYRLYNAHAAVDVEQKLFRSVSLSEDREQAAETLALLAKGRLEANKLDALWRAETAQRKVKAALETLICAEPSRWLVRHLARLQGDLSEGEIRAALARAQFELSFQPPAAPAAPARPRAGAAPAGEEARAGRVQPRQPRPDLAVTLGDLIEAGLVRPPLSLSKSYLGRELTARVERDGQITCVDRSYSSLSAAAAAARASVRTSTAEAKAPATNGWAFWRFRDSDGQLRPLQTLRSRYRSTRVTQLDQARSRRPA